MSALLYNTIATGRITGHTGDYTDPNALVLRLYYTVNEYTLTFKSLGGQIALPDGSTPENTDQKIYFGHSFTPLPKSQVTKVGYELVGWLDPTTNTTYPIRTDGTFAPMAYAWGADASLEAVWKALPCDVTVVSIKVNHDGNAHVAKVDTYPKNKEAGLTWTVAKWDSATPHDSSLYADKWGNVNPSLSASEQLFWKGYTHMTYGMVNGQDYLTRVTDVDITLPNGTVIPAGTTVTSSIDGFGYEREVVLPDGSTVVYVFYYAGYIENPNPPEPDPEPWPGPGPEPTPPEIDDSTKIEYTVNVYKINGNGQRETVSTTTFKGYADSDVYADALYHGQTPPAAGTINWYDEPNNTEWNASDIAIEGYTYIEQGGAQADYYPANVNNWKTVSHGRLERVTLQPDGTFVDAGALVLNLYYEANVHTFTLNLDVDTTKGTFTAPAGWTLSADGRSISREYRTGQTTVALPADLMGTANHHNNTAADPYRAGYELVGWSTANPGTNYTYTNPADGSTVTVNIYGAEAVGKDSKTIADFYRNNTSWLVPGGSTAYLDASVANPQANGIYSGVLANPYYTPDGVSVLMPATDLQLWAVWSADENTEYTVYRYKIDGNGNKVLAGTDKLTGFTDQLMTVDRNYVENILGLTAVDTDDHIYLGRDLPIAGYTYEREIKASVTLPDGTVVPIPGAGTKSNYASTVYGTADIPEGRLAADGSTVFELYYGSYQLDPDDPTKSLMYKVTFHPANGTWTADPNMSTSNDRVLYFFADQSTGNLYGDLNRDGYDFLGWTTDVRANTIEGMPSRDLADQIVTWPGWGGTDNAYVTAWAAGQSLTDGTAHLYTKVDGSGYGFIMPGADVDIYGVWKAQLKDVTVAHIKIDREGNATLGATEYYQKGTGDTWTVGDYNFKRDHDSETYVDRYGRHNPTKKDVATWGGYSHLKSGPFLRDRVLAVDITKADGTVLVPAGTTFSSSITPVDGYGYEVETVLADGSTVVFVFYYAGVWFNPDPDDPDPTPGPNPLPDPDPDDPNPPVNPDPDPDNPDPTDPDPDPEPLPDDPYGPNPPTPEPDPDPDEPNVPPSPDPDNPDPDDYIKVYYVVNRWKITGDSTRVLETSHLYKSYVGNTINGDAITHSQTPGVTGTQEWWQFDKPIAGYTYVDEGQTGWWSAAHPEWATNHSGTIQPAAANGYGLILNLYYGANEYELTYDTMGGQYAVGDGTTPDTYTIKIRQDQTFTPPARDIVTKQGYELIGWLDPDTNTTYNIHEAAADLPNGWFDSLVYTWGTDKTLEAVWRALPAEVTIVHVKIDHAGNAHLAVTEHDKKETASTWTVAERDNTELHDSETFVDRYGRLNPNKGATAADWRGYTHLKNGPFLKDRVLDADILAKDGSVLVAAGTLISSSIDGFGYEREVVLADGTTVVYVFYYAGYWNNPDPDDPNPVVPDPPEPDPTDPHDPFGPDPDPTDPDDPDPKDPDPDPDPLPDDPYGPNPPTPQPDPNPDPDDPTPPNPDDPNPDPDPDEAIKVYYVVNRWMITGDTKRELASSHLYKSYVGNTINADAIYHGQTPGVSGTTEWYKFDKPIEGYTYLDPSECATAFWYAAHPEWTTTHSGVIQGVAGNGYGLVLDLYYAADEHTFTLNLDVDTTKGTFTAPSGWTLSADGRSISRTYRTGQTTVALPADLVGTSNKHNNPAADPYRAGYELVGWSTENTGTYYGAGYVGNAAKVVADAYLANAGWLVPGGSNAYLTASQANPQANGIYAGLLDHPFYTPDGVSVVMPATDLQLWAVWTPDANVEYTVNRYKIDGAGNKVLVSTHKYTGVTDQLITADRNYVENRLHQSAIDSDDHTYFAYDVPVTGYTYEREIPATITLPDGTVMAVPGAGTKSIYKTSTTTSDNPEGRLAGDGSTVFDLYYAAYAWDPDNDEPLMYKVTFHTGSGLWTADPENATANDRVLYFFSEQNTGNLYGDIVRPGYDFYGWTTDKRADGAAGFASQTLAADIQTWPGWGGTENAYVTAWNSGQSLTDGTAHLFTKVDGTGYGFIMPGADVDVWAVWSARDDVEYVVEHIRVDGNGNPMTTITETLVGTAGETVTAIDRIEDADIVAAYDAASKPYNRDANFAGFEVTDDAGFSFPDGVTPPLFTGQNTRSGVVDGANTLGLILYYTPRQIDLTYELGFGDWNTPTIPTDTSIKIDKVLAGETINIPYGATLFNREGYDFRGWTLDKETVVNGKTLDVTQVKARDSRALADALQAAGKIIRPNQAFTMPNTPTTLYAVWSARSYTIYFDEGTTTWIDTANFPYSLEVVTDEELILPNTDVVKRDSYDLVGWYIYPTVTLPDGSTVNVGTSQGMDSRRAAGVAEADTRSITPAQGNYFTSNNPTNPNIRFVVPPESAVTTLLGGPLTLHAVWSASPDTPYIIRYYKVDGNGTLKVWHEFHLRGIAGETYTIANPHDPAQFAAASGTYGSCVITGEAFSAIDWRSYTYMTTAIPMKNDPSGYHTSASELTFTGFMGGSSIGPASVDPSWDKTVVGNITVTIAGASTPSVIAVVMESDPLNLILNIGAGGWLPGPNMPLIYEQYQVDANGDYGVREGQDLQLPSITETNRWGYTLVGWYYVDSVNGTNVGTSKGLASIDAANAAALDGGTTDGVVHFTPAGSMFHMPNHDVTLYAVWSANTDTTYQVVRYIIDGNGKLWVYDTIEHTGVTDEIASAVQYDASKPYYWNDDREPEIKGYDYVPQGTYANYLDSTNTLQSVTSTETGEILGHEDWWSWPRGNDMDNLGVVQPPAGQQCLILPLYFTAHAYQLTIDMGAGKWKDDAVESRPAVDYFPAFPGQQIGNYMYPSGKTVHLPIDQRYGGQVTSGIDSQGRPYSLRGYAYLDGSLCFVDLDGDGIAETTMEDYEVVALASQLNGLDNFAYINALIDAGIFVQADDVADTFDMWTEDITLYALWALSVQPITFIPGGYADINDPAIGTGVNSLYYIYYNPDGTIDTTRTTAQAVGGWNTEDGNPPAGFEDGTVHNIQSLVPFPSVDMLKRPGYKFVGWARQEGATQPASDLLYKDVNGDGILDAPTDFIMPADEVILYGVWQALEVELIYDPNDPDATDVPAPTVWFVDCQTSVTLDEPKKTGYRLKGWAITPDATDVDYMPGDPYDMKPPVNTKFTDPLGNPYWQDVNPNVLYAVWEVAGVTLEYWGETEASADAGIGEVLLKTVYVQLDDLFDYTYDPNKDDDPMNDYLSMRVVSWVDDSWSNEYNQQWVDDNGFVPTIQFIADQIGWNGIDHIKVYSILDLRYIEVTFETNGYDEAVDFEVVQYIAWTETPYQEIAWLGRDLYGQLDDSGNYFDDSMTCGDILLSMYSDPKDIPDSMVVYFEWFERSYDINLICPNITEMVTVNFEEEFTLPVPGVDIEGYDGYTFMGWFTEPDGQGAEITDGMYYAMFESDDNVLSRDLYAYFVPDGTVISVEMETAAASLDAAQSFSVQTATVAAPQMNAAAVEPRRAAAGDNEQGTGQVFTAGITNSGATASVAAAATTASTADFIGPIAPAADSSFTAATFAAAASAIESMAVAEAPTFVIDMLAPAAADTDFIGPIAPAADAATFAASTDLLAAATDASTTFIVDMATPLAAAQNEQETAGDERPGSLSPDDQLFTFTVNYYKDFIAGCNLIGTEEGIAPFGAEIVPTKHFGLEGYEPQPKFEGAFQVTQNAAENVLNVVYKKCADVAYKVFYYRGSICEDNLIAEEKGEALPYGTVVELPAEALNCQCPKGYAPLEQGRSFRLHHDPARNVMNVIFHPNFDEFYAAGIAPLRVFYDGLDHVVAPKGVMAGDTVTYLCNGSVQTRVVDEGKDYGMAFSKATQGEVPLVVTLTRAGVTSNAIQTLVNIIPQVQDVFVPGDGEEQGAQASKPSAAKPRPSAPVAALAGAAVAQWVNPSIAVPTPSYSAEMAAEALAESGAAEVSSSTDANPLAATPLLNKKRAKQGSGIPDAALLIPATLFAAAAGVLLVLRKRSVGVASGLKGSAMAAERAKATKMSRFAILSAVAAAAFYLLWVLL